MSGASHWSKQLGITLDLLKGFGLTEQMKTFDLIRGSDQMKTFDVIRGSDQMKTFNLIRGSDQMKTFNLIRGSDQMKTFDLIKGSGLAEQMKAIDLTKGSRLAEQMKTIDLINGSGLAEQMKTIDLLKGYRFAGVPDATWRSIGISEPLLRQFHTSAYASGSTEWRSLLRDALAVEREDLAALMEDAVPDAPEADRELRALSDWLGTSESDAEPTFLGGWLLWLSVPYQRRVFLASLALLTALTEHLNARSDVELPANLETLIPILVATAVLLSEWLDRPSSGE